MAGYVLLLAVYTIGGLTFIPILVLAIFVHGYFFLPQTDSPEPSKLEVLANDGGTPDTKEKLLGRQHEPDVAAAYFAVCREYVPGGLNGKPPERTTPAGETIAAESPSVYQSMYRSIFERNKTQTPSIESGKTVKKARNVFYVVLRHGHLLLFDNAEQLEVRHVISLAFYHVDIFGGGDEVPEGELYIKRNCIRLVKKGKGNEETSQNMPFYLFSDNCSEKEDFYHAMLHSQAHTDAQGGDHPITQMFDTEDMIKLVRALHLSDEHSQVRWLNAISGRLFLGLYKTLDIENFIRTKIEKKISRVSKPAFITSVVLQHVDMGSSAPTITNPRLKEITVDGNMTVEADIKYSGGFKVVISAVATIELGARFKPRTVTLVLATILKRLEGHILVRIKPPPSNRIWITFETTPKLEVSVEPIVSSRQITYGIILRAIESRIREVLGETLVFPNSDDFPFFSTEQQACRGGIWEQKRPTDTAAVLEAMAQQHTSDEAADDHVTTDLKEDHNTSEADPSRGKVTSTPHLSSDSLPVTLPSVSEQEKFASNSPPPPSIHTGTAPKSIRSNSFATAASPVITRDDSYLGDGGKANRRGLHDATRAMKELSMRPPEASPVTSAPGSSRSSLYSRFAQPSPDTPQAPEAAPESPKDSKEALPEVNVADRSLDVEGDLDDGHPPTRSSSHHSSASWSSTGSHAKMTTAERKAVLNQSLNSATTAAKKWGINVLSRQQEWSTKKAAPPSPTREDSPQLYGRGQPLPPPGTPLPRPAPAGSWSTATLNALRRKPTPAGPQLPPRAVPEPPPRRSMDSSISGQGEPSAVPHPPPLLPSREAGITSHEVGNTHSSALLHDGLDLSPSLPRTTPILAVTEPEPASADVSHGLGSGREDPIISVIGSARGMAHEPDDEIAGRGEADDSAWLVDDDDEQLHTLH